MHDDKCDVRFPWKVKPRSYINNMVDLAITQIGQYEVLWHWRSGLNLFFSELTLDTESAGVEPDGHATEGVEDPVIVIVQLIWLTVLRALSVQNSFYAQLSSEFHHNFCNRLWCGMIRTDCAYFFHVKGAWHLTAVTDHNKWFRQDFPHAAHHVTHCEILGN